MSNEISLYVFIIQVLPQTVSRIYRQLIIYREAVLFLLKKSKLSNPEISKSVRARNIEGVQSILPNVSFDLNVKPANNY